MSANGRTLGPRNETREGRKRKSKSDCGSEPTPCGVSDRGPQPPPDHNALLRSRGLGEEGGVRLSNRTSHGNDVRTIVVTPCLGVAIDETTRRRGHFGFHSTQTYVLGTATGEVTEAPVDWRALRTRPRKGGSRERLTSSRAGGARGWLSPSWWHEAAPNHIGTEEVRTVLLCWPLPRSVRFHDASVS